MRTLQQAYKEIVQNDPNTGITLNNIREWARFGTVPTMKVGNRYLVSMEAINAYIADCLYGDGEYDRATEKAQYIRGNANGC